MVMKKNRCVLFAVVGRRETQEEEKVGCATTLHKKSHDRRIQHFGAPDANEG